MHKKLNMKKILFILLLNPIFGFSQQCQTKILELRDSIIQLKSQIKENGKGIRCSVYFDSENTNISLKVNGTLFLFDASSVETIKVFFLKKKGIYTNENNKKCTIFCSILEDSRFFPKFK